MQRRHIGHCQDISSARACGEGKCGSQVLSMHTLATLATGRACSVSWKAICRAGSFVSFAAALKLSRASRYCPAQTHQPTHV